MRSPLRMTDVTAKGGGAQPFRPQLLIGQSFIGRPPLIADVAKPVLREFSLGWAPPQTPARGPASNPAMRCRRYSAAPTYPSTNKLGAWQGLDTLP